MDNNYFCESCLPTDYEPSPITGTCVKKTPKVPAITWKDIYRLQMNQQKQINGRDVYGPSLTLRDLTNSQINTGHSFLIYLTFKVLYTDRNRILEEEKKIPTICEIVDSVDESEDEVNVVEYNCIGNLTQDENEELNEGLEDNGNDDNGNANVKITKIEEGDKDNKGILGNSNLNEIASKNIENLDKEKPTYSLANYLKTVTFLIDNIENQTSSDNNFDFTLSGQLTKELAAKKFETQLDLAEIENKKASCAFEIKENKTADLSCQVNLEEYKEYYNNFSFKVKDIETPDQDKDHIYLAKINEILLIHEEQEKEEEEEEEKKKTYLTIIAAVVPSVAVVGVALWVIIYCIKKKKNIGNLVSSNCPRSQNNFKFDNSGAESEKRIEFQGNNMLNNRNHI